MTRQFSTFRMGGRGRSLRRLRFSVRVSPGSILSNVLLSQTEANHSSLQANVPFLQPALNSSFELLHFFSARSTDTADRSSVAGGLFEHVPAVNFLWSSSRELHASIPGIPPPKEGQTGQPLGAFVSAVFSRYPSVGHAQSHQLHVDDCALSSLAVGGCSLFARRGLDQPSLAR